MPTTKVLIVDDEEALLESLKARFEAEHFAVWTAHDGEEALDVAKKARPHLMILDVMMPKLDGWDVCRKIRSDPELENTPIIMLTARDQVIDRALGLRVAGANRYVTKPFEMKALVGQAKEILGMG